MLENGKSIIIMAREHFNGQMAEFIKENTKRVSKVDMESLIGLMENATTVIGFRENNMD